MKNLRRGASKALLAVLALGISAVGLRAHHAPSGVAAKADAPVRGVAPTPGAVSGQGKMRFHVLVTADKLPDDAKKVLEKAHGGFAVDRRPGKGETYFALPGAGILQISPDFQTINMVPTDPSMKDANMHNAGIWYAKDGTPYLMFPGNDVGKVFTTTLDGKLVSTLSTPTANDKFAFQDVHDYFFGAGKFVPTDVDKLGSLYYISTGYSPLDFILTARVTETSPIQVMWNRLGWGGKGEAHGQFRTSHGITVPPGLRRIDVSDRPNSRIERFTPYGHYLSTLKMPAGSLPCDVCYLDQYMIVAALDGPDTSRGSPLYIYENDRLVSTIMPKEELGLVNFKHNHNAVLTKANGKYYIIVQAWNPGDFAILEQVTN
ncbi:MAG: hypothetical protein HY508_12500 [Acidobacteria bacterium]|nr:hypothetical protein [Acidobacteriota bacterium]